MQNPVDTGMHVQMAPYAQPARKSSRMKSIFTTGILQIIGGTILILCGFVLVCVRYYIPYRNNFDNSICGIWGGSMLLVTGIIGVHGANRKRWFTAYLICTLVSILLLIIVTVIGAVAAADNVHYWKEHPGYHHYDDYNYPDQHGVSITKLAFHLVLCIVGSLEIVVCVLAAVFSCTGMCPGSNQTQTITYQPTPMQMPAPGSYPPLNVQQPPSYPYPPQPGDKQPEVTPGY
ncbi:uncharacterized protein [Apostichopus japonicus]|uniref:uncharacterized protein n=1 Tax=Stichopus japonicus TaxID=307972 RepID=UPI003AB1FEBE